MPAFDPVRDAVLNSPITQTAPGLPLASPSTTLPSPMASPSVGGRRAIDLSVMLNNSEMSLRTPPPVRSSTLSHLLHSDRANEPDDKLGANHQPLKRTISLDTRTTSQGYFPATTSPTRERESPVSRSRPSSSSSTLSSSLPNQSTTTSARLNPSMPPPPPPATVASSYQSSIPYNPVKRITPPTSILVPLSPDELELYRGRKFVGKGTALITGAKKRKRSPSSGGDYDQPPLKRHAGDVGVIADHYNSRPDVGVQQRQESPIIGLKNFNNWVKSVLITRFAHPVLAAASKYNGHRQGGRQFSGKVLDMGCGKGGDITKWAKARVKELCGVDIADVSVDQARSRWESLRNPKYYATFAALDCYTQPLTKAFAPSLLGMDLSYGYESDLHLTGDPFDVVSMQFCMHYAFETEAKTRCMLENVSRYLRRGGVFIGTVPNAELLLERLDELPPNAEELSFGNSVYQIRFEQRHERPMFGHRYWFYLKDAVDDVPEYLVHWENFVEMAAEYDLYPKYKQEFHQVFSEHQEDPEFKQLMIRMKVVDSEGESAMDEDQWEAANIYVAFAFEKQ